MKYHATLRTRMYYFRVIYWDTLTTSREISNWRRAAYACRWMDSQIETLGTGLGSTADWKQRSCMNGDGACLSGSMKRTGSSAVGCTMLDRLDVAP